MFNYDLRAVSAGLIQPVEGKNPVEAKKRLKIDFLLCVRACMHVTTRTYISQHYFWGLTCASSISPYGLVVVPIDPSHAIDTHLGDPPHLRGHTQHISVSNTGHTHSDTLSQDVAPKQGSDLQLTDEICKYKTKEKPWTFSDVVINPLVSYLQNK